MDTRPRIQKQVDSDGNEIKHHTIDPDDSDHSDDREEADSYHDAKTDDIDSNSDRISLQEAIVASALDDALGEPENLDLFTRLLFHSSKIFG